MELVVNEFTLIELRIIQSLWIKKSPEYIAMILDRSIAEVNRKIQEMNLVHRVTLFERPIIERKIRSKEKEKAWAEKQLADKKPIKVKDTSGLISVRLDRKTIVMVKPGTDIEKLKKRISGNRVLKNL